MSIYAEFPITCSLVIDDLLLVGGGGGAVKSGIKNGISIYNTKNGPDKLLKIASYFYESDVPMYLLRVGELLVVCCDYHLYVYDFKFLGAQLSIQHIKTVEVSSDTSYITTSCMNYEMNKIYLGDDCGGIYKFNLEDYELISYSVCDSQITSLSMHPDQQDITVTTRGKSFVRNISDFSKKYSLDMDFCAIRHIIRNSTYYKSESATFLYTIHLQIKQKYSAYIVKWSTDFYYPLLCIQASDYFLNMKTNKLNNVLLLGSSTGRLSMYKLDDMAKIKTTSVLHSAGISSIATMMYKNKVYTITVSPDGSISITPIQSSSSINYTPMVIILILAGTIFLKSTNFIENIFFRC